MRYTGFQSKNSCDSIAPPPRTAELPAEDPISAKAVGFERAKEKKKRGYSDPFTHLNSQQIGCPGFSLCHVVTGAHVVSEKIPR